MSNIEIDYSLDLTVDKKNKTLKEDFTSELKIYAPDNDGIVSSYTEWDPLEEVVIGRITGGVFPSWQETMRATMPETSWKLFQENGGAPFPTEQIKAAERELDIFAEILTAEGIKVVRPDLLSHENGYSTPNWIVNGGLYAAMPRDLLMVVGDIIIEAPMAWRCRYHEVDAFRSLIKNYFKNGARWIPGPRPQLVDNLYTDFHDNTGFAITEFEPVFDAADFVRFGRDIVVQKSHATNEFGISWLQSVIGSNYRVHCIDVDDPHAMHIDATIMPLAPGRLLVNPERFIPNDLFSEWEIIEAPTPSLPANWPMYFSSSWLSMNVLSLDEKTVVVEKQEQPLIDLLNKRGFKCIPVNFRHFYTFGGSFHCATLDVRRQGKLRSYL